MDEKRLINEINQQIKNKVNLMEVCGTHTHEIKRLGLESVLSNNVNLISGPGCPVCVSSCGMIDQAIECLKDKKTIVTFGDMVKVKGTTSSLKEMKIKGYKVIVIYSPLDLFNIIRNNIDEEIIFLGVGFETTAPVIASVIKQMKKSNQKNVSFLLDIKRMKPILIYILSKNHKINGIVAPGHVATITGSEYFRFITEDYHISCAICGFTSLDILSGIYYLSKHKGKLQFINLYSRAVRPNGNPLAKNIINEVFEESDAYWRGIGSIKYSGYRLNSEYKDYDAINKYQLNIVHNEIDNDCCCDKIMLGLKKPTECKYFRIICHPNNPLGPCMVSSEGCCLAYYKYGRKYG